MHCMYCPTNYRPGWLLEPIFNIYPIIKIFLPNLIANKLSYSAINLQSNM